MKEMLQNLIDWLFEEDKKEITKEDTKKYGVVVEIPEKTEEEILAEKITDKFKECKGKRILNRCYKVYVEPSFLAPVLCFNGNPLNAKNKPKEYLETFYQYLSKAVDRINDHVEKKQEKRRQMELKCMKEFINDK